MNEYKLMIAGDHHFADYHLLKNAVDNVLADKEGTREIIIVSGADRGAGMLGERYAAENGYEVAEFAADITESESECCSRIREMAAFSDHCLIFWDGRSRHTKDIIDWVIAGLLSPSVFSY